MGKYDALLDDRLGKAARAGSSSGGGGGKYGSLLDQRLGGKAPKGGGGGNDSILGKVKSGLGSVLGSKPVATVLDVVDTPRAAVVSLGKELGDLAEGEGFSGGDLVSQTAKNYGFGDFLEEEAGDLPLNVKRGLGLVGDIGLDPLTYLTFGASAAAKGGTAGMKAGTRLTTRQVADLAIDVGRRDLADQVLKARSASVLDDASAELLGIDRRARLGVGQAKVAIPHSETVSRLRAAVTNPVIDAVANTKAAKAVRAKTDPLGEAMSVLRKTQPAVARTLERAERQSRNVGDGVTTTGRTELDELHVAFGDVDGDKVRDLIESGAVRKGKAKGPEGDAARALADWFEGVRQAAETASGRTIPKVEDYFPHQLTDEYRQVLDEAAIGGKGAGEAFTRKRKHLEGKQWFGETLREGSVREMEEIAKRHLGDEYVQVFRGDPWEVAQAYARSVGRMVGDHRFLKELEARDLTRYFDDDLLKRAVRSERKARQGVAKAQRKAARAEKKAGATLNDLGEAEVQLGAIDGAGVDGALHAADEAAAAAAQLDDEIQRLTDEGTELEGVLADPPPGADPARLEAATARLAQIETERAALAAQAAAAPPPAAAAPPVAGPRQAEILEEAKGLRTQLQKIDQYMRSMVGGAALKEALDAPFHTLPDGTRLSVRQVREQLQARVDELGAEFKALSEAPAPKPKKTRAKKAAAAAEPVDPKKVTAVKAKAIRARKAVEAEQLAFDAARAAEEGWASTAAHVAARKAEIEAELASATTRRHAKLAEEADHLDRAEELAAAAEAEADEVLARIAMLEATAEVQVAEVFRHGKDVDDFQQILKRGRSAELSAEWSRMVHDGLVAPLKADPTRFADPDVARVLTELGEKATPKQVNNFLKAYDSMLGRWKAYSLLSPGFHIRNDMGAHWNNWMADVSTSSEIGFLRALHHYKKGGTGAEGIARVAERMGPKWGRVFQEAERLNIWGDGNLRDLADVGNSSRRGVVSRVTGKDADRLDPTSMDFAPLQLNLKLGSMVERRARGVLFADRLLKGMSPEAAMEDVIKYHFDYSELSKLEQTVGRRLVPFYTWSRKNFPLQIENLLRNPAKFNRYSAMRRNLELGTEEDPVVPGYYEDQMAIKTPWSSVGGDPLYLTPDIPINRIDESPTQQFWNGLTPGLKLPIELKTNTNLFTGNPLVSKGEEAGRVPTAWGPLAPMLEQLDGTFGLPQVTRGPNGEYLMDRREMHKIESTLPLLGRMRRLVPGHEKKYQDRQLTSYLSILAGVNGRTLTQSEIESELARRRG